MKKIFLLILFLASTTSAQSLELKLNTPLLTVFSANGNVSSFSPTDIDSLQMWFDASEGVDLANFQVMSWASKISDDTLFSYYADSTVMNLNWLYEDYQTNYNNPKYKGLPVIVGSNVREYIKLPSQKTYSEKTVIVLAHEGSDNVGSFTYNAGDYFIQQGASSTNFYYRMRKSGTFLNSTFLGENKFYMLSEIDSAKTYMGLSVFDENGFIQDTSITGSLYYNPSFLGVWRFMANATMLYEVLVYNRKLSTDELTQLYDGYVKPKYIDSTPTQPSEIFEYVANDSVGKGAFLGNIAMIGDLQYDSTLGTSITWAGTGTGTYKLDSAFSFLTYNSPFNNEPIDMAIFLGDMTNYSGVSEFSTVGAKLEGLDIPYLVYPGNHDNIITGGNFGRFLNFYNTYNTYNSGASTMPDYLSIEPDPLEVGQYWTKGTYTPSFDSDILFVIAPQINNPSEYPNIFRYKYNYAWIDSVIDANPTKNIILLTHEGLEPLKGGVDGKRNYRNVSGALGSHWVHNGKLAMGFNGHHNEWRVCGSEYPTFSWTTGGFNQGASVPNITYAEVYENKIFINNYSWAIHYGGGTQSSVAAAPEGNPYGKSWYENGVWVKRSK